MAELPQTADYGRAMQFVTTAKVCNDCCERAIKLGSEYAQILTKDNEMRNKILQGFTDVCAG